VSLKKAPVSESKVEIERSLLDFLRLCNPLPSLSQRLVLSRDDLRLDSVLGEGANLDQANRWRSES